MFYFPESSDCPINAFCQGRAMFLACLAQNKTIRNTAGAAPLRSDPSKINDRLLPGLKPTSVLANLNLMGSSDCTSGYIKVDCWR
jgi:hypothetical protein